MKNIPKRHRGFSLIELMTAVAVFSVLAGAAFLLLQRAQQRFKMESESLDSFQAARTAMDQLVRDIHTSGYPPTSTLPCAVANANAKGVAWPFAWSPNYVPTPGWLGCPAPAAPPGCTVGTTCTSPGDYDLIVETDVDPQNNNGVEWVRYSLQGTTLWRGTASKAAGADPMAATRDRLQPYVENVLNNAPANVIATVRQYYPNMFPGGNPVPVFRYVFDSASVTQVPANIREINVTLIVAAPEVDPVTQQPRVMTLTGVARRINPQ